MLSLPQIRGTLLSMYSLFYTVGGLAGEDNMSARLTSSFQRAQNRRQYGPQILPTSFLRSVRLPGPLPAFAPFHPRITMLVADRFTAVCHFY